MQVYNTPADFSLAYRGRPIKVSHLRRRQQSDPYVLKIQRIPSHKFACIRTYIVKLCRDSPIKALIVIKKKQLKS